MPAENRFTPPDLSKVIDFIPYCCLFSKKQKYRPNYVSNIALRKVPFVSQFSTHLDSLDVAVAL